jgi:hypothetical protein
MSKSFQTPRPSLLLMWILGFVNRWLLLTGLPLVNRIHWLRDLPFVRGYFWLRDIDLPEADAGRFRRAVNPRTAAFVGPNHPEFGFDWMMDKELATRFAPRIANWASHHIVATAPGFWLRNNLISHNGGQPAVNFSVDWALRGNGVLLHPEGSVHWTAGRIHPLFNGLAEMACEAARRAGTRGRPVYIVPIVWRVRYVGDISAALHREMDYIERALGLGRTETVNVGARMRYLQDTILDRQMAAFGFESQRLDQADFFARQDAFRDWLLDDLLRRYPVEAAPTLERLLARVRRAIRDAARLSDTEQDQQTRRQDHERAEEVERLCAFTRETYDEHALTQEEIAESLKRIRAALLRRGLRNVIHNFLPRPYGLRIVHVRVPEPIRVDPLRAAGDARYVAELVITVHDQMQACLDRMTAPQGTAAALVDREFHVVTGRPAAQHDDERKTDQEQSGHEEKDVVVGENRRLAGDGAVDQPERRLLGGHVSGARHPRGHRVDHLASHR